MAAIDPAGKFHTLKLLSHSPDYEDPSIEGISRILSIKSGEPLPENSINSIRLGSTVATNALLERKGGKVILLISKGFRDLLEIGNQARPDIFTLSIVKPSLLYTQVYEIDERIDHSGVIVNELDRKQLSETVEKLKCCEIDAVAVVFIHAWKNPAHELLCFELLKARGIQNIFLSHQSMNLIKAVGRGQSTVLDAYLSPVIKEYLNGIRKKTGGIPIKFINSAGGLSTPEGLNGKELLLSGPAGGVVAVANIVKELGLKGAIGFDMGGTSTDVSRYDGVFERLYEHTISGVQLQSEMFNIETVAAGGGSILDFDGQRMKVGPQSAGAYPGPACYGFGGPLTVTDANLLTGRILPDHFPGTFGAQRDAILDRDVVKRKFYKMADRINRASASKENPEERALGFLRIANEKMALAIKEVTLSKGVDVRDYTLICFGGAGGQHACQVASLLEIAHILYHPLSSIMSAYGIGLSVPVKKDVRTVLMPYDSENHKELLEIFEKMEEQALKGADHRETVVIKREVDLRPMGMDTFLTITLGEYDDTIKLFRERYKKLYGFYPSQEIPEAVNVRVEIQHKEQFFPPYSEEYKNRDTALRENSFHHIYHSGGFIKVPLYKRETLPSQAVLKGPAFIVDSSSTLIIEPGFKAEVMETGIISLHRVNKREKASVIDPDKADPVLLEVFNNLFMSIAESMGQTLKHTSRSVNIKERLDFSCALFDAKGELVANAPHIPVHIGSMSDAVKALIEDRKEDMRPGDLFLTNNPYRGGSHLPDLTLICPVYSKEGEIIFYTAARGHHADIGGKTAGSLPPETKHIREEGVLIDSFLIVRNDHFKEDELTALLSNHDYPARNIEENIHDIKAQIASCRRGEKELARMIEKHGLPVVKKYMQYVRNNASFSIQRMLQRFLEEKNSFKSGFRDYLDDSTPIQVNITITGGFSLPHTVRLVADFSGTGDQHREDNLNMPISVTRSAVLYVLRLLTDEAIPLNSGCMEPVEIIAPKGSILNPEYPSPVASGNVETSQRVVDVLLGAFGAVAASQGTMNNLAFKVEGDTPYYETIAGGSGAVKGRNGASGVQVHMTNTRMTDPEVVETRHSNVMVDTFMIRRGSGGKGVYKGGDGVVRGVKFLKPASVSIISERRKYSPYGTAGGEGGKKGENLLIKKSGKEIPLPNRCEVKAESGDKIVIKTPGGGGYGKSKDH